MKPKISIAPTHSAWVEMAVDTILHQARKAITERGLYTLVLSGGSTPAPVYARLAQRSLQEGLDWKNVAIFWGDERCVPPDDALSNYLMARQNLLDHIPILPENVFRMMGEMRPAIAAQDYESVLKSFFPQRAERFDTILLGLGEDGHTASLFPGTQALNETEHWVVPNNHPGTKTWRITLTYPLINQSRQILFLVSGASKAKVAASCIQHAEEPPAYPAKGITGSDSPPHWLLDVEAAQKLSD